MSPTSPPPEYGPEKRNTPRFPWIAQIRGVVPPDLKTGQLTLERVQGGTRDISSAGLGINSDRQVLPGSVLRCEITAQSIPVPIPTLLRVCWSDSVATEGKYRIGLTFLI